MFSQTNRGKIKNAEILSWRLELSRLHYDIRHKPGVYDVVPDALSRSCALLPCMLLRQLHESLGNPGFTRLYHFVHQRNFPYSSEEAKTVCRSCRSCAEIKPRFFTPPVQTLIKTLRLWDNLSLDFNPLSPAKAPNLAELCNPITHQAIELESYPNHPRIQQVLWSKSKQNVFVFGGGFPEVTSQRRHVLEILVTFGRP